MRVRSLGSVIASAIGGRRTHESSEECEHQPLDSEVARVIAVVKLPLNLTRQRPNHAILDDRRTPDQPPDPAVIEGRPKG